MDRSNISELDRVLDALGINTSALLGYGGESWVFALDGGRVARISRPGTTQAQVAGRQALLAELQRSASNVPFVIPEILDIVVSDGYTVAIERRLPGRPLDQVLAEATGEGRDALVRAYLDAAAQIGNLALDRPWFGELRDEDAVRTDSFPAYLEKRAGRSLQAAGPEFAAVDPQALAAALPEPPEQNLVHLDAFPGNMLAEGESVTAVIDFGASLIMGDRRLDPLTAAVYLAPPISPAANDRDRMVAQEWLSTNGLADYFAAAEAWVAAYWSFARDDAPLYRWCRSVLLSSQAFRNEPGL